MESAAYSIYGNRILERKKRVFVLVLMLAMYSCATISSFTSSWTITYILTAAAGAGMLLAKLRAGKGELEIDRISVLWMILAIVCLVSSARNNYYQDFVMLLLCTGVIMFFNDIRIKSIYSFFPFMTVMALVFTFGEVWQYFFTDAYYRYLYPLFGAYYRQAIRRQFYFHRMCTGFTSQTVISAEFIIIGICAVYCMMPFANRKRKIMLLLLEVVFIAGVLLTGKRSSPLLLAVAYFFAETRSTVPSKRFRRTANIILIAAAVSILAYFFVMPRFVGSRNSIVRFLELFQNDEADISNGRFNIYSIVIDQFYKKPFFGSGWGWVKKNTNYVGAHNIYLQLLCECGIVGSIPFFAAFVSSFLSTLRHTRSIVAYGNTEIMAVLKFSLFTQTFILVYGMVGNPIYDYSFLLWYVVAVCMDACAGRAIARELRTAGNIKQGV